MYVGVSKLLRTWPEKTVASFCGRFDLIVFCAKMQIMKTTVMMILVAVYLLLTGEK